MADDTSPVLSLKEIEPQARPAEFRPTGALTERFELKRAMVGARLGLRTLGCSLTEVPPGKTGYPFHSHRVNDEMFYILSGQGELRLGNQRHAVAAGDLIGCPAGGPETAHQLINTGQDVLRYLAISSELDPEICEYPDSGKIGVWAGDSRSAGLYHMTRATAAVGYWDGE